MRDLYLDADDDIELLNGDLRTVDEEDSIAQSINLALTLFQNEWFLDGALGLPYFDSILVKNPNLISIREIYRQKLINLSGVDEIVSLDLNFDQSARNLSVSWVVTSDTTELSGTIQT